MCRCAEGYTPDDKWRLNDDYAGDQCIKCAAGKYKDTQTNLLCDDCAIGFISIEGASICTVCAPGSIEEDLVRCVQCAAGKFKDNSNHDNICQSCPDKTRSDAGDSICTECNPGKYEDNNVCELCAAGTFKDDSNQDNTCLDCLNGHVSSAGASSCTACGVGKYKAVDDTNLCSDCPIGTTTRNLTAQSTCEFCADNFQFDNTQSCQCIAGYEPSESLCFLCPADLFKPNVGADICQACPYGVPSEDRTYCVCPANTELHNTQCMPCQAFETSTQGENCVCVEGFIRDSSQTCKPFQETCNINQRLPSFALKLNKRGYSTTTQQEPPVASRQAGGVCHSGCLKKSFEYEIL